ncbi:MAG: glycosyltransferase family 4 protein [Acidimicrobiaceae bacterium]|nr:glycosyltransferase family 4 protein [Acidimicrobiia bacterium]MCY4494037.1 glycosyltransferase family 4 protein [Acidimicrobiaceae bacterium]
MRIGLICPYSLTMPGGVQSQVLALARALRRRSHAVRVLAPCDGPPPDAGVTPLGLSLPASTNGSVAPVAPDPSAQLRVIRAMRDEAFDVIHLHEPLAPGPTTTALLTRPAPLIGTFHAAGRSLSYELMPKAVRYLAARLDDRVAVSEDARELAMRHLGGEYGMLFNGVEVSRYRQSPAHASGSPTVLFVGRHEERKGLQVLLEAVKLLPADIRVWIAGSGPETQRLKSAYGGDPRLEWLGPIDEADKTARLRGADVFCAPSLFGESFGIVLLEAMAAGTPVVASDIGGYANASRQGRDALLFPAGDHRALAEAVGGLLADRRKAAELVVSGNDRADEFSMDRLAELYLQRYRALLR